MAFARVYAHSRRRVGDRVWTFVRRLAPRFGNRYRQDGVYSVAGLQIEGQIGIAVSTLIAVGAVAGTNAKGALAWCEQVAASVDAQLFVTDGVGNDGFRLVAMCDNRIVLEIQHDQIQVVVGIDVFQRFACEFLALLITQRDDGLTWVGWIQAARRVPATPEVGAPRVVERLGGAGDRAVLAGQFIHRWQLGETCALLGGLLRDPFGVTRCGVRAQVPRVTRCGALSPVALRRHRVQGKLVQRPILGQRCGDWLQGPHYRDMRATRAR